MPLPLPAPAPRARQQCSPAGSDCWASTLPNSATTIRLSGAGPPTPETPCPVYGRPLRYLVRGDVDVQQALLRQGAARPFWPTGTGARAALYDLAAAEAQDAQLGLWAACP
jgi:hypothetical protein